MRSALPAEVEKQSVPIDPEGFEVWTGFHDVAPSRPVIATGMGGFIRDQIPYEVKSLWLRDRRIRVDSWLGETVLSLWREMGSEMATHEAEQFEKRSS